MKDQDNVFSEWREQRYTKECNKEYDSNMNGIRLTLIKLRFEGQLQ